MFKTIESGPALDLVGLKARYIFPDLHPNPTLGEPGIIVVTKEGKERVWGLRHPIYRPFDVNTPGTYEADCILLVNSVHPESQQSQDNQAKKIGLEAELCAVNEDGEPYDLHPNGRPIAHFTNELLRSTLEVQTNPEDRGIVAYNSLQKVIGCMAMELASCGAFIDPATARMQDIPSDKDFSSIDYAGAWMGAFSDLYKFIGVGIHEHHNVAAEYHPLVCKYLRVLAPYLNLGLHAAPFAFGEITPDMHEAMSNDELRRYAGSQPSSVRYLVRLASRNGGVGRKIAHSSLFEMLRDADIQLKQAGIYSPARVYGNHADVRNRLDTPPDGNPNHPGRIELCVRDTGAFRLETNRAYGELTAAVIDRLVEVAAGGEELVARLHCDFPELFGKSYDTALNAEIQLERTHRNSLAMAYHGPGSEVESGEGKRLNSQKKALTASEQFKQIIKFATQNGQHPLSLETHSILQNSILLLSETRHIMAHYLDDKSLPSFYGYLETGKGTPASWMIARAQAAKKAGMKEKQIMTDGTKDRTKSFLNYVTK